MRRPISAVLLAAFALTGCYHWSRYDMTELRADTLQKARVSLANGARYERTDVTLQGDSLVVLLDPANRAVPADSVTSVEVRKVNWFTTILLGYLVVGTVAAIIDCAAGNCY
jgi:hypothetical protein